MKKLILLILALALACMMIPAMAEEALTGDWYTSLAGVQMILTLNADGTLIASLPGLEEPESGTWTLEGDQLALYFGDSPTILTVTDEGLKAVEDELELNFTREPVVPLQMAAVKTGAAAEEYYGTWQITYVEAKGYIVEASLYQGLFPNVKLAEGAVEFLSAGEYDAYSAAFNQLGLACVYTDGSIILEVGEGAKAVTFGKCEILEDGMLKFTLNSDSEESAVFYYTLAESAD